MCSTPLTPESPRFVGPATFFRTPYVPDPSGWDQLDIALAGVPFDGGTTNRPGARLGPRALREQTTMISPWNPSLGMSPFAVRRIADVGDAWVREPFSLEPSLAEIAGFYRQLARAGIAPVTAGGDHSVSLPILRAIGADTPLAMVHIDAHCDTGMGYMGSRYHHGAPFSRAVEEGLLDPARVVQIGIRGSLVDSSVWQFSHDSGMRVISMDEVCRRPLDEVVSEIRDLIGDARCYLSFDIDALDPAFAPGTGTPVAGGFSTREAIQLIRGLRGLNLVGADLVEVAPSLDSNAITALAGATIMFEMLCIVAEASVRRSRA